MSQKIDFDNLSTNRTEK